MTADEDHPTEDSTWGLLPVEVTLQVFLWLDWCDLSRAELVCRSWYATINPASPPGAFLWRTVHPSLPPFFSYSCFEEELISKCLINFCSYVRTEGA
jgi:hypothetical protein